MSGHRFFLGFVALLTFTAGANGQQPGLRGKSLIELSFGLWNGAGSAVVATVPGISTSASTNGLFGSLAYYYGVRENLTAGISLSFIRAEATSSVTLLGVSQKSSAVTATQVAARLYPFLTDGDSSPFLFLFASVGPVFGFEASNATLSQEARTETAFGLRGGAGIDFMLGSNFLAGADAGYFWMTDFQKPVGARNNYNGFQFALRLGFVW